MDTTVYETDISDEGKTNGRAHYIDASAILNGGRLHVFATNCSLEEAARVHINVADRNIAALDSAELLTGPGAKVSNSFEHPDIIKPSLFSECIIANGRAELELAPLSVSAMTFRLE